MLKAELILVNKYTYTLVIRLEFYNSNKNVTEALTSGKITGAIGYQSQNTQKLSRKESLELSHNIGFGIEQYL